MKNTEQDENQKVIRVTLNFSYKKCLSSHSFLFDHGEKMSKNRAKKDALEINFNQTNLRYVFPVFWCISTQRFSNTFPLEVQLFPGSSVKGLKTRD